MPSQTADGWMIYLDSIATAPSIPEPHIYKDSGVTKAELLAMGLEATPGLQLMAEEGTEEDHILEIVMSQELDLIKFELHQGRLRAFLTWRDFVRVHLIGWRIVDLNGNFPFCVESQMAALSSLLKTYPSTDVLDVAEEDFFEHMWASRHEAWIRLVLNAVRFAWADRVTIRTEVQEADMV